MLILSLLTFTMLSQTLLMSEQVDCMRDVLFEHTASLNNYFAQNQPAKHILMVYCGLMMDVMVLTALYRFAFYGTTWRLPMAFVCFYGLRACIQVGLVRNNDFIEPFHDEVSDGLPVGFPRDVFSDGTLREN